MRRNGPSEVVDPRERVRKKDAEARRLRGVPPERTLAMAFELIRTTRALAKGAEDANA